MTTPPDGAMVDAANAVYHRDPLLSVIPAAGTPWDTATCWGPLPGPHGPCTVQGAWDIDPRENDADERSWHLFRGWCTCGWAGAARGDELAAAVDLANHAWPGWWDQPVVPSPRQQAPSKRGKKAPDSDLLQLEHRTVLRVAICPGHSSWPSLCRGCVPQPHASILELCSNPAHYDLDAAAAFRADVDLQREAQQARRAAAYREAMAWLEQDGPIVYPAGARPHSHCARGEHLHCWWTDCPCPCHHPDRARLRTEAKSLWVRLLDDSTPAPARAAAPARPAPDTAGQLSLF